MDAGFRIYGELAVVWTFTFFIITTIVHIAFAIGVYQDSIRLKAKRRPTEFVSPPFWVLGTLLGGIVTVVTYWAIHHSTLSRGRDAVPLP